jgi:hypothetical protein
MVSDTKYLNIQSTTVYVPSSELRLSHTLSRQRVYPSPRYQRWGDTLAGEGFGDSQFRRLEKKLSTLPTLWFQIMIEMLRVGRLGIFRCGRSFI